LGTFKYGGMKRTRPRSFNGKARVLYDDWCDAYNRVRPHSSLGYQAPAAALINLEPSLRVDH
jgi:transposase InsO family protein